MHSIPGLYATETWMQVFLVTGIIGGAAAWATGKAIAESWRPYWQIAFYMLLLGAAVRFAHFALFKGHLLSLPSYLADMLYLLAVGSLSFRITRTSRMVSQYRWLYERTSPLSWRKRAPQADENTGRSSE
jgi:hypothetical protein